MKLEKLEAIQFLNLTYTLIIHYLDWTWTSKSIMPFIAYVWSSTNCSLLTTNIIDTSTKLKTHDKIGQKKQNSIRNTGQNKQSSVIAALWIKWRWKLHFSLFLLLIYREFNMQILSKKSLTLRESTLHVHECKGGTLCSEIQKTLY